MADFGNVSARLGENGIAFAEVRVGGNHVALLPERGTHLLGPFDKRSGESALWLSTAFSDSGAFRDLLERGDWNVGGMRLWIAPEIRFGVRDRRRYWETLTVQPDMEPRKATLSASPDGRVGIAYDMALDVFNPGGEVKKLRVKRSVRAVPDPLAALSGHPAEGMEYFGFVHDVRLEQGAADGIPAEAWNLVQVKGGGAAIVPTAGALDYADYYEPLEKSHLTVGPTGARLLLDGRKRFKIGVRSHCHFGRMGYIRNVGGAWELIVCNYYSDPGACYSEQPADAPDCRGLSMHFYNDGGMFGGFGELEANGRTLGLNGYPGAMEDSFSVWRWRGDEARIRRVAGTLLGNKELL